MSSLTLLGTGTCQIQFDRIASSVLLELDKTYILFDCGHGVVQRLLECGIKHRQVDHIILSHFHADHVSDLIPFLQAGAHSKSDNRRENDVHIYGPPGVQQMIDGLKSLFEEGSFQRSTYQILVHEVTAGPFTVAGHAFESVSLPPAGNHGIRFSWDGKTYALTGDSHFHEEEIAFLQGVDLAVIDSGHLSEGQIAHLAAASQARVIICSHFYKRLVKQHLQKKAEERGYKGNIVMGHDFMSFML